MNVLRFVILTLLFSSACASKSEIKEEDPQRLRSEIPATEVITVLAKRSPFEYLIQASGKIQSVTDVQILCRAAGILKHISVSNGTFVQKGTTLAEMENEKQKMQLDKAGIQLAEKQLAYEDQMLSYAGMVDSVRFGKAKNNNRITSGLATAEINYREAKLEFENTFIKATATGRVSNLEAKSGSALSTGQVFCYVHDPDHMIVVCTVLEADALRLTAGTRARITTLSEAVGVVEGSVKEINPRVDEKTNLVKVILTLSKNKNLLPGMSVNVILIVPYEKNIIVPKEAVVIRSGKQVVFTAEGGLAKWNYVTVGRENGKEIEITEGLKENQSVIITNNLQLAHDAPVKENN